MVHVSNIMWRIKNQPYLTSFLVVTMPYACWFLWRAYYIEDIKWHLHFQFEVALLYWGLQVTSSFSIWGYVSFWRVVLREVYFEGSKSRLKGIEDFNLEHWLQLLGSWMPHATANRSTEALLPFRIEFGTARVPSHLKLWYTGDYRLVVPTECAACGLDGKGEEVDVDGYINGWSRPTIKSSLAMAKRWSCGGFLDDWL